MHLPAGWAIITHIVSVDRHFHSLSLLPEPGNVLKLSVDLGMMQLLMHSPLLPPPVHAHVSKLSFSIRIQADAVHHVDRFIWREDLHVFMLAHNYRVCSANELKNFREKKCCWISWNSSRARLHDGDFLSVFSFCLKFLKSFCSALTHLQNPSNPNHRHSWESATSLFSLAVAKSCNKSRVFSVNPTSASSRFDIKLRNFSSRFAQQLDYFDDEKHSRLLFFTCALIRELRWGKWDENCQTRARSCRESRHFFSPLPLARCRDPISV